MMRVKNHFLIVLTVLAMIAGFPLVALAHGPETHSDNGTDTQGFTVTDLSPSLKLIEAGGGNIVVLTGSDGTLVIDNGLSDREKDVVQALETITDKKIDFLINTHWHFDHTGNNARMGQNGTTILAHENVRSRLAQGGRIEAFDATIPPAEKSALPVITYTSGLKIHLNDETLHIIALDPAHTDGDSFIVLEKANLIHTGDIVFNGFWPFIDQSSGGSLKGVIQSVEKILDHTNDQTRLVPGHGPLADRKALEDYLSVLKDVQSRILTARKTGLGKEDWIKSAPLADLDPVWGDGILPTDTFAGIAWDVTP